jgi:hypothetical protein
MNEQVNNILDQLQWIRDHIPAIEAQITSNINSKSIQCHNRKNEKQIKLFTEMLFK